MQNKIEGLFLSSYPYGKSLCVSREKYHTNVKCQKEWISKSLMNPWLNTDCEYLSQSL